MPSWAKGVVCLVGIAWFVPAVLSFGLAMMLAYGFGWNDPSLIYPLTLLAGLVFGFVGIFAAVFVWDDWT